MLAWRSWNLIKHILPIINSVQSIHLDGDGADPNRLRMRYLFVLEFRRMTRELQVLEGWWWTSLSWSENVGGSIGTVSWWDLHCLWPWNSVLLGELDLQSDWERARSLARCNPCVCVPGTSPRTHSQTIQKWLKRNKSKFVSHMVSFKLKTF